MRPFLAEKADGESSRERHRSQTAISVGSIPCGTGNIGAVRRPVNPHPTPARFLAARRKLRVQLMSHP